MKPIILKCFVLLLVFCGVANAYKGVVFQDNFENVPAVTLPNTTADADPSAQIGLWWGLLSSTSYESQPYAVQVADNAGIVPAGSSKFLSFQRLSSEKILGCLTHTVNNSEIVTIEFDYYCPSGQGDSTGMNFATTSSSTSFDGSGQANLYILNTFMYVQSWGGFRVMKDSATYLTPVGSQFAENTWHHVRYDIDLTAETYNLTISGVTYENLAFRVATGVAANGKLTAVYFSGYAAGTSYYLDNLIVTGAAPEPGPEIAGKLFFDDFEGVDAVIWPDTTQEADPVAKIGTWGTLTANNSTGVHLLEAIQVSDNTLPGPADGNNFVSFSRVSFSLMVANWTEEKDASEAVVLVEFDLCVPSTSILGPSIGIQEWTAYSALDPAILTHFFWTSSWTSSGGTGGVRFVYSNPAGSLVYPNFGSATAVPTFRADVWHHVRFEIDIASQIYAVEINGIRYENLPFKKTVDSLGHMYFGGYQAGSKAHYDNVTAGITGTVCTSPIRADLDGDCMVNLDDLTIFTNYWLTDNEL